jgi:hypothetical protein
MPTYYDNDKDAPTTHHGDGGVSFDCGGEQGRVFTPLLVVSYWITVLVKLEDASSYFDIYVTGITPAMTMMKMAGKGCCSQYGVTCIMAGR